MPSEERAKLKIPDEILEVNPHLRRNWRKKKKLLRNLSDAIERQGYFEDCNYHPCRVTNINPYRSQNPRTFYSSDVDGESLINGKGSSCSLPHCGPLPLTEKEAIERAEYSKANGRLAYLKKYVYGPMTAEQEAELIKFYKEFEMEI